MNDPDEQLPGRIARGNWIVLALLLLGSLPFRNPALSMGILAGGLVAILGFVRMRRSLRRLLEQPGRSHSGYQFDYIFRLLALGAILAFLIAVVKIHVVGLIIGLSVVIINLIWMTAKRAFR